MAIKSENDSSGSILSFIKKKETSYERLRQSTNKTRFSVTHNGKPTCTKGSASARVRFLPGKYRQLSTRHQDWYKVSMREWVAAMASYRRGVRGYGFGLCGTRRGEVAEEAGYELNKGEYLVPSKKAPTSKSLVRQLPPDMILKKLSEMPPEQRNLLTPTLDSILLEAKITLPGGIVVEGKDLIMLIARNATHTSKTMMRFVHSYELLTQLPLPGLVNTVHQPTYEEIVHYAEITPAEFLAEFMRASHEYGVQQAKLVVDLSLSRVVGAVVRRAVGDGSEEDLGSYKDSELLMKAGGLIAENSLVTVNNNNSLNQQNILAPGAAQGLPAFGEVAGKILDLEDVVDGEWEEVEE